MKLIIYLNITIIYAAFNLSPQESVSKYIKTKFIEQNSLKNFLDSSFRWNDRALFESFEKLSQGGERILENERR